MSSEVFFIDFKKYYENIVLTGNYFGVYVPIKKIKYPKLFAIYCFVCFFFIMGLSNITQYLYVVFETHSIRNVAECAYIANVCMTANVKSYFLFRNRKEYIKLFNILNNERFQPKSEEAMISAKRDLEIFFKAKRTLSFISYMACAFAVLIPLRYKDNRTVMTAWLPFDFTEPPIHQVVYVWQAIGISYNTVVSINGDILATGLMTFLAIQCDFLCFDLRDGKNTSIKEYVEYHRQILEFTKLSQKLFSKIYLFQYFATTTGLCMTLFLLTLVKTNSFEFLFLMTYQAAIFNLLSVPSWFSSELTRRSENIPMAAYVRDWLDTPKSFKRDLMFFIHRTQESIQFKAVGLFNISIQVFLKIVQSSFSYYTMLRNVTAKQ